MYFFQLFLDAYQNGLKHNYFVKSQFCNRISNITFPHLRINTIKTIILGNNKGRHPKKVVFLAERSVTG